MKVRKEYHLYVNRMTNMAFYGGDKFLERIQYATLGELYDCTFKQLKQSIRNLSKKGIRSFKMKY